MPHASFRSTSLQLALALLATAGTGCTAKFLYVGSSVPAIETFDISPGSNGLPRMARTSTPAPPLAAIGDPSAMAVVGTSLYVAGGSSVVAQFAIDPATGALTLGSTVPAGSPPHYLAATRTTVYVGSYGSASLGVYSIGAGGSLSAVQTVAVGGMNSLQLDGSGKFLFTGSRAVGGAGPQLCTHAIQANGSLGATPSCMGMAGAPAVMVVSGGVLYLMFNAIVPPSPGNSNWVSAWTIDPASGALTRRGPDLDIGAANAGGMAVSTDGQTLYIPRQGNFTAVNTTNLTLGAVRFPPGTGSQWCVLPPPGPGDILTEPTGKALFITDPLGVVGGNAPGPRVSALEIAAGGELRPITCETAGRLPHSMAIFIQ